MDGKCCGAARLGAVLGEPLREQTPSVLAGAQALLLSAFCGRHHRCARWQSLCQFSDRQQLAAGGQFRAGLPVGERSPAQRQDALVHAAGIDPVMQSRILYRDDEAVAAVGVGQ